MPLFTEKTLHVTLESIDAELKAMKTEYRQRPRHLTALRRIVLDEQPKVEQPKQEDML